MSERPAIVISEEDFDRLSDLLERQRPKTDTASELAVELDRATLVPASQRPAGVVAMNSRIRFLDEDSGRERDVQLVYPGGAGTVGGASSNGAIVSVLAPAGAALLGLGVGDRIDWPLDGKHSIHLRIIQVSEPQPEGPVHD